jgi:DNA-binding CsgD family transcriptional regulator
MLEEGVREDRAMVMDCAIDATNQQGIALAEAVRNALDCISTPTFVLQLDGMIVHANMAGLLLLRAGGTLREGNSRLMTRSAAENKVLAAAVARVAEKQRHEMLRLLDHSNDVATLIAIGPVAGHPLITVCVADLRAPGEQPAGWTRKAFGLSPQNAQLAESLISGISLREFSLSTGVTLGAARTRLKKLFVQTGTRSQASLVSVLSRAAALAPFPSTQ